MALSLPLPRADGPLEVDKLFAAHYIIANNENQADFAEPPTHEKVSLFEKLTVSAEPEPAQRQVRLPAKEDPQEQAIGAAPNLKLDRSALINIKKDALWKPLLRQFRRYVKRLSMINISRRNKGDQSSNAELSQESHSLYVAPTRRKVGLTQEPSTEGATPVALLNGKAAIDMASVYEFAYEIYDSLDLPAEMRTQRNACATLLLVQSQKLTRKRILLPKYEQAMRQHLGTIIKTFFYVFNENSRESRVSLFSERLIQILWTRFCKTQAATVKAFLTKMASSEQAALR